MSLYISLFITLLFLTNPLNIPAHPVLPEPDPASVHSQTFLLSPTPPATIPAFPEQSNVAGCPLDLPEELYSNIKSSCGSGKIHRTRCCPVLAAWLYSAYSKTALHRVITKMPSSVDMPVLPDDSETCVDSLEKELGNKGIELVKPNETCDVVYCYCGIRLHPLTCPEAFYVNSQGMLVGDKSVKKLEKDCLSSNNGYSGLAGCSKCLNSLYKDHVGPQLLNIFLMVWTLSLPEQQYGVHFTIILYWNGLSEGKVENTSRSEGRTKKMHSRDCQLMGLTWLLNKNRSGYIHTVSAVLRALMMSKGSSDPRSCTLDSDGMPLAVDSSEINDQSSAVVIQASLYPYILPFLVYISFLALLAKY